MKVWVLIIDHKHGADTYVCDSYATARRQLWEYVRDNWEWEIDEKMPADQNQAIEEYFESLRDQPAPEFYEISEETVINEGS